MNNILIGRQRKFFKKRAWIISFVVMCLTGLSVAYMNFTFSSSNLFNYYTKQLEKCIKVDHRSCEGEVTTIKYGLGQKLGGYRELDLSEMKAESNLSLGVGSYSSYTILPYFKLGVNYYSFYQRAASEVVTYRNTGVYRNLTTKRNVYFAPLENDSYASYYSAATNKLASGFLLRKQFDYLNKSELTGSLPIHLIGLPILDSTVGVGNVTTQYTSLGLPEVVDKYGVVSEFKYHPDGNLWKSYGRRDGVLKITSTMSNYKMGTPQLFVGPTLVQTSLSVSDDGKIESATDGLGNTVSYKFDSLGREISRTPAVGLPTVTNYPSNLEKIETRGNIEHRYNYNSFGQELQMTAADLSGQVTQKIYKVSEYDGAGRLQKKRQVNYDTKSNYFEETQYDSLDRVVSITRNGDWAQTKFKYESPDLVTATKPLGYETRTWYRNFDGPTNKQIIRIETDKVLDPSNSTDTIVTQLSLDPEGKLLEVNQDGVIRKRFYNKNQLLERIQDPEKADVVYSYYSGSDLIKTTQAGNSAAVTYNYDDRGLQTNIDYTDASESVVLGYNKNNILEFLTTNEVVRKFDFDNNGNKKSEQLTIDGMTFNFDFQYDGNDYLKSITYPDIAPFIGATDPSRNILTAQVDAFGRAISLKDTTKSLLTNVSYHANGMFKSMIYANGVTASIALTPTQWPELLTIQAASKAIQLKYNYRQDSNLFEITDNFDSRYTQKLDYDGAGRLVSAEYPNGAGLLDSRLSNNLGGRINYSNTGNLLQYSEFGNVPTSLTYNDSTQLLSGSSGPVTRSFTYDEKGNTTSDSIYNYKYGSRGDLQSVSLSNGGLQLAKYGYDGHNIRVKKLKQGSTTYYFYLNNKLFFEASSELGTKEYFYLGKNLVATKISKKGTLSYYQYHHFNPIQSTIAISDAGGNLVRENYNSYGSSLLPNPNFKAATDLRYTGHVSDDETNLIYMVNRYFDPSLGRFLQVDSADFNIENFQSFNRYSYANNNPHKFIDPDGKVVIVPFVFGAIAAYEIGSSLYNIYNGDRGWAAWGSLGLSAAMAPVGIVKAPGLAVKAAEYAAEMTAKLPGLKEAAIFRGSTVWRVDSRSPEMIKEAGGFFSQTPQAASSLNSLLAWSNAGVAETAWVSTTTSKSFAKKAAQDAGWGGSRSGSWLYPINAPEHGVNVFKQFGSKATNAKIEAEIGFLGIPQSYINFDKAIFVPR